MDGSRKATPPSEMTIKRAANGGYIVRHHYDNSSAGPSYRPPDEHAFKDHKSMMAHVHKHSGGGDHAQTSSNKHGDEETHSKGTKKEHPQSSKAAAGGHPSARTYGAGVD